MDVLAVELSGGHAASNGGWESSRWVFRDGIAPSIAVDWDERTGAAGALAIYPAEVVANDSTYRSSYAAFFGINSPSELGDQFISYIPFNLWPTINIAKHNFTITVSAWDDRRHGGGTPYPNAFGILACTVR